MSERVSRQSFLGKNSEKEIASVVVGIVGLGGGGSHIVQQLAHVGFKHFVLVDPQRVEESNINRLVGMTEADIDAETQKIDIATRVIKGVRSNAQIIAHSTNWQVSTNLLKECDILFGCIDGFQNSRELEAFARRYLIPYIDIGMDVHISQDTGIPRMAGQVILSMPGKPCMKCLAFPSDAALTREAEKYGDAGPNPQVVWVNGVLASTAVAIAVDLVTGWTRNKRDSLYLAYDANDMVMYPHVRFDYRSRQCEHYPPEEVGLPKFRSL